MLVEVKADFSSIRCLFCNQAVTGDRSQFPTQDGPGVAVESSGEEKQNRVLWVAVPPWAHVDRDPRFDVLMGGHLGTVARCSYIVSGFMGTEPDVDGERLWKRGDQGMGSK